MYGKNIKIIVTLGPATKTEADLRRIKDKGVDFDQMGWYADLFKYGAPPHGGVGFGLDRIVQR